MEPEFQKWDYRIRKKSSVSAASIEKKSYGAYLYST
jgi:hypothetical protein